MKYLMLGALLSLSAVGASASDVYFYNAKSASPFAVKSDVRRLTFTPYHISVVFNDGRKTEYVELDEVEYFSFFDASASSIEHVGNTEMPDGTTFHSTADGVTAVSSEPIESLEVYSMNGLKVASSHSVSVCEATISLGGCPSGLYFAKAVAGGKVSVFKFLKR